MRTRPLICLLRVFALLVVLAGAGSGARADVFGRPDGPAPHSPAASPSPPLPLPGFVRAAVRTVIVAQARLDETLQDEVVQWRAGGSWRALLVFIGLSLAYGVLHALAPGHGKTIVAAYFGSRAASARRVAAFTLTTALGQSLTAVALVAGALALFEGTANAVMHTAAPLELVSAVAILGVASLTALRIVRRQECCAAEPDVDFSAGGRLAASGADGDSDGGTYLGSRLSARFRPDVAQPYKASWLALAVALRPCAGALFVLLIAARYQIFWLGIAAAFAIGAGVAATTFALGYAIGKGRVAMLNAAAGSRLERLQRRVALAGALFIAAFSALQIALIVTGIATMTPS
ncbi:HoxN/HupN/NixA family nickel/cobalt transporter [Burkholderia alba]|uniref:HoxN/HupN/NixA family nickel/cobalt transporter n=1 Tax=Burkholderia alba TaxID=2683677 RepID=UPI002B060341|nr:hypothetical protein [Burkholderia alba]